MRPEGNPLDLNNLPDEYSRDGKQLLEDTSSPGCSRKKKNGGKEGKEECEKVYECRFCSLKFCKSQALGGHMNRHRQERETETLNHARQLVFRNDHNIVPQPPSHLGCCPPIAPAGGYHPATGNMGPGGDPTMPLRFPRYFSSGSSSSSTHMMPPPPPPPQPSQPYLYASPTQPRPMSFPTHLIPMNEYHVGHVLSNNYGGESSNYTCIGAPVGVGGQGGFVGSGRGGSSSSSTSKEGTTVQEEGLNWGRSYSGAPSAINRFQDHGF